ncbi:MAG: hypothetical protein JSW72_06525 [Candidatus Bathyarchaeota archaeon]|nr:MAG: hypothetical protein JSW72_06525 [Candidatus Bathyarchaeota archaeon]
MSTLTIKAVLFDLGNTLVKYDFGVPEEVFQRVLTSLGISRSLDDVNVAFLKAAKEAEDLNLLSSFGKMRCENYWSQWDSLVLRAQGQKTMKNRFIAILCENILKL